MEEAAVMMTGLRRERVLQALAVLEAQFRGDRRSARLPVDYAVPNVSEKIVRIILSYTDYVRGTVWREA
jgi:UDP-N-acetylglucosamine 2-epimerase (non-hydrolysing)